MSEPNDDAEAPPRRATLRVTAPGIYAMSFADYLADPCPEPSLSRSIANVLLDESPRHAMFRHPRLNPIQEREDSEAFDIGTCAHALFLEGSSAVEILDYTDWRTKAAQEARAKARAEGKQPLLRKVWDDVYAMASAAREQLDVHQDGGRMFRGGVVEPVLVWKEKGVWCRARLDYLRTEDGCVDDYKTTRASANPEQLSRAIFSHGWDIQQAFYRRGVRTLQGGDPEFRFAVQEVFKPYALSVVSLGPHALTYADDRLNYALEAWREGLRTGAWPGYPQQTAYAALPPWLEQQWYDRETREEVARAV